jgi:gluconolactonase
MVAMASAVGLLIAGAATLATPLSPVTSDAPVLRPAAVVDLDSAAGLQSIGGVWRYSDARLIEVGHREPGGDLKASGAPNRTWDIAPHAGAADFDDASWETLAPGTLTARRGHGRLSFNWYRLRFTVPEAVGKVDVTGTTAVFEVVVDDYAEVWVDGRLPLVLGQTGGGLVRGYNAPNRVVVSRDLRPGTTHTIAVFGANGPLSEPPANFIWLRSASLEIFPATASMARRVPAQVNRLDAALDEVIAPDAAFERVATGFLFTEGPVWHPDGYLLFSDPNANTIYRWSPDGQVSVFRAKSGYAGADIGEYGQPGSNGLTLDAQGRLTIDEHGNRRVVRLEKNGAVTTLADRFEGKRLNSPNDLVYRSDGALYFTDPPFGLPKAHDDPRKELPFSGLFLLKDGRLTAVSRDLAGPNGLAFSPDEKTLYVGDWDPGKKVVMKYEVHADGTLGEGAVFADFTADEGEDAIDGLKVDRNGNVYVSGPGGLHILDAAGRRLGLVVLPEHPHNLTFGDDDGKTLYLAAKSSIYRVRVQNEGIRPPLRTAAAPAANLASSPRAAS